MGNSAVEATSVDTSPPPHGCLTALVFGTGLAVAGGLGIAWVFTLDPTQFPGGLPLDLGRALGYALLLGVPGGLVALLLRSPRFALWRGFGLALALAGAHAGLVGTLLAVDRVLPYPGLPSWLAPLVTLLYGLALTLAGRRRFSASPPASAVILGVGLGLLVSAAWVVVGALGTLAETLLAVLEALSTGLVGAVLCAALFFYDEDMLARQPFWSAVLVALTFGALENGLLAVRGWWVQGILLSQAFAPLGYLGGVLLTWGEKPEARHQWWSVWAFLTVAFLLPFAWTEGFEGDWMLDDMGPAWFPGAVGGLGVALVLGWLALALRGLLARRQPRAILSGAFGVGSLLLVGGLYVGFGQPGIQPEFFFVVMADQADTSFARDITQREERVTAIYQTLTERALSTQADLRAFLDERGVPYTPYYLVNGLEVEGGPGLRRQIAARDDVARVLNNPHTRPLPPGVKPLNLFVPASHESGHVEWGIDRINAEEVWRELGVTGEGIVVGQADSGVDWTHPALRDSYLGSEGSHDYTWFDPWDGTREPTDAGGHGTHTLGIVLGQDGIGVAPGAHWIACRNLARNLGDPAYYLDCMQFLFAPFPLDGDPLTDGDPTRGAHVTNNSWGCPPEEGCDGMTLSIGVNHLRDAGQMMVVSAGNEGPKCSTVWSPASADSAFSVGASQPSGEIAGFSSRGPVTLDGSGRVKPDVVAPGVEIVSSIPDDGLPGTDYGLSDGTSMAGPHVTGLVALMWSANPDLIGDIDGTERIIEGTATPRSSLEGCGPTQGAPNNVYGFGLVNALEAVKAALELE